MKICLLLLCFLVVQPHESRGASWDPRNIFELVSNKTYQVTHFVQEKGQNVKQKIYSYYDEAKNVKNHMKDFISDKHEKVMNKFDEYVNNAKRTGRKIIDVMKPGYTKESCLDDDPSVFMSTPQLIALHGYSAQSHTLMTDDGYILTLHRIPSGRKISDQKVSPKTILLHHGLLGSSADWVLAGPEKGLAFILSDAGYDVWMANVRGNTYSKAHVSRRSDSYAFWNFTWHDVSQHDLPAIIDYIIKFKGQDTKINYIGHSMGTTVLFALLSTKPEYNRKLRAGYALAPVAYMSDIKSPIRLLAPFAHNIEFLMKLLGANEFLPQSSVMRWLSEHACEINHYEEILCENSMFVLCGHDEQQFNQSLLPLILSHVPAGASTKSLVHYAQEIHVGGRFQQFDFGRDGNLKEYGKETPPEYPLQNITLPIALLSAQNDWLAGEVDVLNLYKQLPNPIEHYIVPLKQFNHIDFLWAVDAPKLVYKKVLQLLERGPG